MSTDHGWNISSFDFIAPIIPRLSIWVVSFKTWNLRFMQKLPARISTGYEVPKIPFPVTILDLDQCQHFMESPSCWCRFNDKSPKEFCTHGLGLFISAPPEPRPIIQPGERRGPYLYYKSAAAVGTSLYSRERWIYETRERARDQKIRFSQCKNLTKRKGR